MSFAYDMLEGFKEKIIPNKRYSPSYVYFDHLYREYEIALKAKPDIPADVKDRFTAMRDIRYAEESKKITWHDVFECEMLLLPHLSLDMLRNKVKTTRRRYLQLFGEKRYQNYLGATPLDLKGATQQDLMSDAGFLIDEMSSHLGTLTANSKTVKRILFWAGFVLAAGLIYVLYYNWPVCDDGKCNYTNGPVIYAIILAGAFGGVVSIIQRLGSVPPDTDPILNLAALWNGITELAVSPLTGAAFALLLSWMFTSGVLQGKFFPQMETISRQGVCEVVKPPERNIAVEPTPTPSASPARSPQTRPAGSPSASPSASPSDTASPTPAPDAAPATVASPGSPDTAFLPYSSLLKKFFYCTRPTDGAELALLLLWCFLAGFAERLVPDALTRLVKKSQIDRQP